MININNNNNNNNNSSSNSYFNHNSFLKNPNNSKLFTKGHIISKFTTIVIIIVSSDHSN